MRSLDIFKRISTDLIQTLKHLLGLGTGKEKISILEETYRFSPELIKK